jgi:NAD-dependent dihydropyrimidine dehydrogenase PreA subunit
MLDAYAMNTLVYDPVQCNGCGMCVVVCPHSVFVMEARKVRITNYEACMECGACQLNCVTGAISVDSGVGCASAMLRAALLGLPEAECKC